MNWVTYALLGMVCMGIGNFMLKLSGLAGMSPWAATTLIFLVDLLFGLAIYWMLRPDITASGMGMLWAILGGVFLAGGILLLMTSFQQPHSNTGIATLIVNVNFALVLLLSLLFLKETLTLKQVLGLAAMVGGLLLFW